MNTITVETVEDVRNHLLEMFAGMRNGDVQDKAMTELNNTAGKILSSAKVQIAYHALRNEAPEIPFLAAPAVPLPVHLARQAALALEDRQKALPD